MIRLIIYLILFAGLAFVAIFFADRPGSVTINWNGQRIQTDFVVLLLATLAVLIVAWILARVWSWLKGGTPLSPERRALRRQKKGLNEVDGALSALAAGDARKALSLGQGAIKHLEGAGIAYVVAAQAATASGKADLAEQYFDALSQTEHGKFLGLRGRVSEARRLGRTSKALELSEEALKAAPQSDWAIATAFELEAKLGKWTDAQATLRKAVAKSIFDAETSARHLGAIRYGQALAAQDAQQLADAARFAKQALAVRPNFVPAAVLAAQLFKAAGKTRHASTILEKTWTLRPHRALAESYAALMPMETAAARLKRFKKLSAFAPDDPESQLRLAEAALGAGLYDEAEEALRGQLEGLPRARAGVIMSQIAAAKGLDAIARSKWADLAAKGAPDPCYECSVCRTQRAYWSSHCPTCDSFNSFTWDQPSGSPAGPTDGDPLRLVGAATVVLAPPVNRPKENEEDTVDTAMIDAALEAPSIEANAGEGPDKTGTAPQST